MHVVYLLASNALLIRGDLGGHLVVLLVQNRASVVEKRSSTVDDGGKIGCGDSNHFAPFA
jgi:hypothetical protein